MIWKALLTGSRAYGTPNEMSDTDIVLRLPQEAIELMKPQADHARDYPENHSTGLRFGTLNLICVTDDRYFEIWAAGTAHLMTKAPVTREVAIAHFQEKGITRDLESSSQDSKRNIATKVSAATASMEIPF